MKFLRCVAIILCFSATALADTPRPFDPGAIAEEPAGVFDGAYIMPKGFVSLRKQLQRVGSTEKSVEELMGATSTVRGTRPIQSSRVREKRPRQK